MQCVDYTDTDKVVRHWHSGTFTSPKQFYLLGTVLPAEITARVAADKKIIKMADQVREKMFQDRDAVGNSVVSQRFDLWNLISLDYRRDSLRYGLRLLTDPTKCEWNWIPLPANLAFLHYVLRPIRLMWEFGVGLAGKVRI